MLGRIPPMKRRHVAKEARNRTGIYVSCIHRPFLGSRKQPRPGLSKDEERVRKA